MNKRKIVFKTIAFSSDFIQQTVDIINVNDCVNQSLMSNAANLCRKC